MIFLYAATDDVVHGNVISGIIKTSELHSWVLVFSEWVSYTFWENFCCHSIWGSLGPSTDIDCSWMNYVSSNCGASFKNNTSFPQVFFHLRLGRDNCGQCHVQRPMLPLTHQPTPNNITQGQYVSRDIKLESYSKHIMYWWGLYLSGKPYITCFS